jgi:Domain of unknown function (DUF6916)
MDDNADPLAGLKLSHFADRVHEKVRIHAGGTTLDAELTTVRPLGGGDAEGEEGRRPFSLIYRGPLQPILRQQIYPVEHPELGTLELFLVAVGPEGGGMLYEAVFT